MCLERSERNDKNYELIEYLNDVNREHAEVLVEQNINGKTDTSYIYGAEINGGFDRISLDRFDGSTGYYLYDARGSVSGITNEEGQVYQSYRYSVTGEITFGAPQYENEYTYNGESYNPNIESQYLRARYYCVVTATFLTEDSYLGSLTEPLTLNRYNYCVSSYLNYTDPSGNSVEINIPLEEFEQAQTYGDIYRLLEKYIIIEAQRMEAEHNAREQEMLNGMQRDYDSGFMKAIMELESDIGISGIYNIVVSPLRYAYQGSSDPYGEAIRNRRQNSQNFYVGVAQFGFDIVDPITHPELITGRIYSGMFAVTNDPGILFQDQMGPALDAWDAVWADDDKTHFNKTGYLFGQILAAVGLGCAKSCIDEGLANTTTRTGAIEDRKGTVYGVAESGSVTKPNQVHHYATNKSKTYTPQLEEIANRYELDLDDAWNKDLLPHQGRHPNAYHEYVLDSMKQFDNIAQGDKDIFLKLFDNLKNNVKSKPDMLYKDYWK